MSLFELKTSKQKLITLEAKGELALSHIDNSKSCFRLILNQINNDRIYDKYLADKDDLTVLDVGANVGLFSLYASDSCRKIFSLEPTPNHFELLTDFCKGFDNINLFNLAASDSNGQTSFYLDESNSTMNSLVERTSQKISVQCTRIDDFIKNVIKGKVDFAKIDIEGSETLALNDDVVSQLPDLVKSLFLEVHPFSSDYDGKVSLFRSRFEKYGYKTARHGMDGVFAWQ